MRTFNPTEILAALNHVLSDAKFPVGLHEPEFNGNEEKYLNECIESSYVSSVGKFVDQFELDLAKFAGAKYAVATSNGTSALHIALKLAGVEPDDEVLVPTLTFVATCNAISYCNATPHLVDSDKICFGVNPAKLSDYLKEIAEVKNNICINKLTGNPIRALCVVHVFGHPVDLDPIVEICKHYHIQLVEDAAEALGSYYKNEHVGHRGIAGILSFNGNKIVTAGGGGAILTDDDAIAKKAKHLTTTAKLPHGFYYEHDQVGYNYRLPNINAALGCAQLEQLPHFLKVKRKLADTYAQAFKAISDVKFIEEPEYAKSNCWLNAILLDKEFADVRDSLLELLNEHKIGARPVWNLMHTLQMYQDCPRMDLSIAEDLAARLISIPSSAFLGAE